MARPALLTTACRVAVISVMAAATCSVAENWRITRSLISSTRAAEPVAASAMQALASDVPVLLTTADIRCSLLKLPMPLVARAWLMEGGE